MNLENQFTLNIEKITHIKCMHMVCSEKIDMSFMYNPNAYICMG